MDRVHTIIKDPDGFYSVNEFKIYKKDNKKLENTLNISSFKEMFIENENKHGFYSISYYTCGTISSGYYRIKSKELINEG